VDWSERLNKLGDSWFSSKAIEVVPCVMLLRGRALCRLGGRDSPTKPMQTPNTQLINAGDTRRVIRSVVKREKAQTVS
jgi:hypothetical protein